MPAKPDPKPDTVEDAESAPGPQPMTADTKVKGSKPTHLNSYGDPVHVRKELHAFVEARGHTPL